MSSEAYDNFINSPTFITWYEKKKFFPLLVDFFFLFHIDMPRYVFAKITNKKNLEKDEWSRKSRRY